MEKGNGKRKWKKEMEKGNGKRTIKKKRWVTPYKINCLYTPTYENPRGFSIRFVFTKLVA